MSFRPTATANKAWRVAGVEKSQRKAWGYHPWDSSVVTGLSPSGEWRFKQHSLNNMGSERDKGQFLHHAKLKNLAANFGSGHWADKSGFTTVSLGILYTQDQNL